MKAAVKVAGVKVAIQANWVPSAMKLRSKWRRAAPLSRAHDLPKCLIVWRRARWLPAVIPIENTLAGTVAEHARPAGGTGCIYSSRIHVAHRSQRDCGPGVKLSALRRVLSHPVALDQCRDFFRHHTNIEPVPFYDTAGSVKHVVAENLPDAASIAGRHAAREYSGKILQTGIEDDKRNFTRFL